MAASRVVALLAAVPVLPVVFLLLARLALRALGWFLQDRTKDRRAAIVAKVQRDRAAFGESQQTSQEVEDGWQNVEKAGIADRGKPAQDGWAGVVGFFHPFW